MAEGKLLSVRLRPGELKALNAAKLLLGRLETQDAVQTLVNERLREILLDDKNQDRFISLGISRQEILDAMDAELKARVSMGLTSL